MLSSLGGTGNPRVRTKSPANASVESHSGILDRWSHDKRHDVTWEQRRARRQLIVLGTLLLAAFLLCFFNGQHLFGRYGKVTSSSRESLQGRIKSVVSEKANKTSDRFNPANEGDVVLTLDPVNQCALPPTDWNPPPRKPNGYLMVRCNGGLNQMRAAICDMVAIARHINATMVIPELDKTSFWADPSDFGDVFDMGHFIRSLSSEVKVITKLPPKYSNLNPDDIYTMDPVSWSDMAYYTKVVLPLLKKHRILRLNRTDSRLANNAPDVPLPLQRLRCRVQYHSLQFTKPIRQLGLRILRRLQAKGPVIALHLRYEMDMLAFTGCTHGCTPQEERKLTKLRYRTERWKEKEIDSRQRRAAGECPLTPEEVGLMLRAMGYPKSTQVYIASGKIYGGKRRMSRLLSIFPNTVRKEMLVTQHELAPFRNHSSQLAALDYMVSVASDVFLSTFHGNMARLVEGHRRYLGHRKTILPDRKRLVEVFEAYENSTLTWQQLAKRVRSLHTNAIGAPQQRRTLAGRPKEEDNFFQNPEECICEKDKVAAKIEIQQREAKLSASASADVDAHHGTSLDKSAADDGTTGGEQESGGELKVLSESRSAEEKGGTAGKDVVAESEVVTEGGEEQSAFGNAADGISEAHAGVGELEEQPRRTRAVERRRQLLTRTAQQKGGKAGGHQSSR